MSKKQSHIYTTDQSTLCGGYEELFVSEDVFYDFPYCFQCEHEHEKRRDKMQALGDKQAELQDERFNKLSVSLKKELNALSYYQNINTHL